MSEWDFAFGLTGQALEDALSSGATYEEWGMIERQLEREDIIGNHYHYVFAFIDAENVPSKFFEQIENGISYFVDKWNAKVYALQKDHATLNWHEIVKKNDALLEIRLAGGPSKNKVDKKIIKDITRAIQMADIGINPTSDATSIRLVFPEMTEENRKNLVKEVKKVGEESKVAIRNLRRDGNDAFKKLKKSGEVSEDVAAGLEDDLQKLTEKYLKEVDSMIEKKSREIMTI